MCVDFLEGRCDDGFRRMSNIRVAYFRDVQKKLRS